MDTTTTPTVTLMSDNSDDQLPTGVFITTDATVEPSVEPTALEEEDNNLDYDEPKEPKGRGLERDTRRLSGPAWKKEQTSKLDNILSKRRSSLGATLIQDDDSESDDEEKRNSKYNWTAAVATLEDPLVRATKKWEGEAPPVARKGKTAPKQVHEEPEPYDDSSPDLCKALMNRSISNGKNRGRGRTVGSSSLHRGNNRGPRSPTRKNGGSNHSGGSKSKSMRRCRSTDSLLGVMKGHDDIDLEEDDESGDSEDEFASDTSDARPNVTRFNPHLPYHGGGGDKIDSGSGHKKGKRIINLMEPLSSKGKGSSHKMMMSSSMRDLSLTKTGSSKCSHNRRMSSSLRDLGTLSALSLSNHGGKSSHNRRMSSSLRDLTTTKSSSISHLPLSLSNHSGPSRRRKIVNDHDDDDDSHEALLLPAGTSKSSSRGRKASSSRGGASSGVIKKSKSGNALDGLTKKSSSGNALDRMTAKKSSSGNALDRMTKPAGSSSGRSKGNPKITSINKISSSNNNNEGHQERPTKSSSGGNLDRMSKSSSGGLDRMTKSGSGGGLDGLIAAKTKAKKSKSAARPKQSMRRSASGDEGPGGSTGALDTITKSSSDPKRKTMKPSKSFGDALSKAVDEQQSTKYSSALKLYMADDIDIGKPGQKVRDSPTKESKVRGSRSKSLSPNKSNPKTRSTIKAAGKYDDLLSSKKKTRSASPKPLKKKMQGDEADRSRSSSPTVTTLDSDTEESAQEDESVVLRIRKSATAGTSEKETALAESKAARLAVLRTKWKTANTQLVDQYLHGTTSAKDVSWLGVENVNK